MLKDRRDRALRTFMSDLMKIPELEFETNDPRLAVMFMEFLKQGKTIVIQCYVTKVESNSPHRFKVTLLPSGRPQLSEDIIHV